tara:strand:- start:267 stop:428 length:162 start_codon:yes stop_codon:yes gene_type:complete
MDIKLQIDQLRKEFEMTKQNNSRVMEVIDALYTENQELKRMLTMKFKDIDDEQ